jgi:hypothetical protein
VQRDDIFKSLQQVVFVNRFSIGFFAVPQGAYPNMATLEIIVPYGGVILGICSCIFGD